MNSRTKLFLENFLIYGIGGVMSRLVPMLMLPVITRLYPTTEYIGFNDLNQTFIAFAQALVMCGMYDAMFRIFFDYKAREDHRRVCSTALLFVMLTSITGACLCILLRRQIAIWYFGGAQYETLAAITAFGFLLTATNQVISAPTRIQNQRRVYLIVNTISPVISYGICIPLILSGHYLLAMPLGTVISGIIIETAFWILNREYFSLRVFDKGILRELLRIGVPLVPNFLVYWLYNSADKLMITHMIGTGYTGVYAVASKMGHISNLIYTAFSGGWLYFAYSTMNDEDQVQLKSNIFEYLGAISFACTILVMGFSRLLFGILFPAEYFAGYLVMPYLFISPLLLMLYQVVANQFSIVKKTYLNLCALTSGAAVNIALNYVLIPRMGIEGASVATVTGYIFSVTTCVLLLLKMKLIRVNRPVFINIAMIAGYYAAWRLYLHTSLWKGAVLSVVMAVLFGIRYKELLVSQFRKKKEKKEGN